MPPSRRTIPLGPDTRLEFYGLDIDGETVRMELTPDDLMELLLQLPKLITGEADYILLPLSRGGSVALWNESMDETSIHLLEGELSSINA